MPRSGQGPWSLTAPEGPHIRVCPEVSSTEGSTLKGVAPVVAAKRSGGLCFGINREGLPASERTRPKRT